VLEVLERHRRYLEGDDPIRSWEDLRGWMEHYLELQRSFQFERGCLSAPPRMPSSPARSSRGRR